MWRLQCEAWLEAQRSPSNGLSALTAPAVLEALRVGSYRLLCQTLVARLGSWPAGIWYATSDAALPRGRLLVGQLYPLNGILLLQQPRPLTTGAPAHGEASWQLSSGLRLQAVVDSRGGQVEVVLDSAIGLRHALQLSEDGQSLVVQQVAAMGSAAELAPAPGTRTLRSPPDPGQGFNATTLALMAAYVGIPVGNLGVEVVQYRRARLPAPADLEAVTGEPPGMALLRQCQVRYRCPCKRCLPVLPASDTFSAAYKLLSASDPPKCCCRCHACITAAIAA